MFHDTLRSSDRVNKCLVVCSTLTGKAFQNWTHGPSRRQSFMYVESD
jgi:hypothetical protein